MKVPDENIIVKKTEDFAIRAINLYKFLTEKHETVMSKQILRSGTSIGANIAESQNAESRSDFIHKLAIATKECNETRFWLKILWKTNYLNDDFYHSLMNDANEIYFILIRIINTSKGSGN